MNPAVVVACVLGIVGAVAICTGLLGIAVRLWLQSLDTRVQRLEEWRKQAAAASTIETMASKSRPVVR